MRIVVHTVQGSFLNVVRTLNEAHTYISPVCPNFDRQSLIQEHTAL